jgi:serine phosphatase RsbU (regulator of sigma subunit)
MITRILAAADAFAAGAPQHDDMTLVVVRVL